MNIVAPEKIHFKIGNNGAATKIFRKGYFGKPFKIKKIGFGSRLCVGKVLGIPQHPFKRTVTLSYLFKNKYDLNFNFILNYQDKSIYTNKNKNKTKKGKKNIYIFGFDLGFNLGPTYP